MLLVASLSNAHKRHYNAPPTRKFFPLPDWNTDTGNIDCRCGLPHVFKSLWGSVFVFVIKNQSSGICTYVFPEMVRFITSHSIFCFQIRDAQVGKEPMGFQYWIPLLCAHPIFYSYHAWLILIMLYVYHVAYWRAEAYCPAPHTLLSPQCYSYPGRMQVLRYRQQPGPERHQ